MDIETSQKIRSAGGKASGEARRRRKTMREAAQILLQAGAINTENLELLRMMGVDNPCLADELLLTQAKKALEKGDTEAAKYVRDTAGERPSQQVEISAKEPDSAADLRELPEAELRKLAETTDPG